MGVVLLTFEVHEGLDGALVVDRSVYCFQRLPSWLPVRGCRSNLRLTDMIISPQQWESQARGLSICIRRRFRK
jgi:hypothetical protein